METVGPAFRISGHLVRCKAHNRVDILADECARKIARGLSGVYDRGTSSEKVLVSLAGVTQIRLDGLALGLFRLQDANPLAQLDQLGYGLLICFLLIVHTSGLKRDHNLLHGLPWHVDFQPRQLSVSSI